MTNLPARIAVMAAGLLLALIGIGATGVFLCVALYAFLATLLPPTLAALAAAGAVLFLSILILVVTGSIVGSLKRQTRKDIRPSSNLIGAEIGKMIGEDAQAFISKNPWRAAMFAVAGGFLVGLSPRLRDLLMNILRR
jgi:hypothetical protein